MNNVLQFGRNYRTTIVGVLAVVSGGVTMITSDGESGQMNMGWTQVLGGLAAIYLRSAVERTKKVVEKKVDQIQSLIETRDDRVI